MKLVLSPAKSLNFESELPVSRHSNPVFLSEAERLNKVLRKKSAKGLSALMSISDALGQLNYDRNQEWSLPFTADNSRPAMYAFDGDVYRGLDAYTIDVSHLDFAQDTVRILSGLYGVLKPLDLMQPYRLEMGTKMSVGKHKNLYEFWKTPLTKQLNEELEDGELFVNLASNEYFKAVDTKSLKVPVYNISFKEFKNGKYKVVSFFAKYARGLMARYIIDQQINKLDDVKAFDLENYRFAESLSSEKELVFTR
jgi:cytoplasmic iron level regulating protein YaaA (DUF328/UPF0246 family)